MNQEQRLAEIERRLMGLGGAVRENARKADAVSQMMSVASFGMPPSNAGAGESDFIWIKLTSKSVVSGTNVYAWTRQEYAPSGGGAAWVDTDQTGTTGGNPAVGLNNEDRPTGDGKRYPARYDPDTGRWIFFLSEGVGGSGVHRFPNRYKVWVDWATTPTLKTGASANVPADGPALAEAVSKMATGFILEQGPFIYSPHFYFDPVANASYQGFWRAHPIKTVLSSIPAPGWYVSLVLHKRDGGDYTIDYWPEGLDGPADYRAGTRQLVDDETYSQPPFCLYLQWTRRNSLGVPTTPGRLQAIRDGGTMVRSNGPKFGESGFWSFPMDCNETDHSNAGNGTIYLGWGDYATTTIVGGGTPASLPANIISGGTPGSLPSNIISGGVI